MPNYLKATLAANNKSLNLKLTKSRYSHIHSSWKNIYSTIPKKEFMAEEFGQKLVEEALLILILIMNILEFIGFLPGEGSFIKAVASMTGIGYVLYKASITEILFGEKMENIDMFLVLSYFMLIVNKFVQFSRKSLHESEFLYDFFASIVGNAQVIELTAFYIGTLGIFILAFYLVSRVNLENPNIIKAIHGESIVNSNFFTKFFSIFIILVGFYTIFFNLIMEWLTLVIDAPLVIIAVFLYIFKIREIEKEGDIGILKSAETADKFVEKFMSLFHTRKTLLLGISGMLVLHLITDIGAFIIPYSLGTESIYSEELGVGHVALRVLFFQDISTLSSLTEKALVFLGYLSNTLGIIYLMIFPAFIWYVVYFNNISENAEVMDFSAILISLFYSLMTIFILRPAYLLRSFSLGSEGGNIVGVDIQTISILEAGNNLKAIFGLALMIFIICFIISQVDFAKKILFFIMTISTVIFFGIYTYYFFSSLFKFYIFSITHLVSTLEISINIIGQSILIFYNIMFLIITVFFYIGGYLSYVYNVFKSG